MAGKIRYIKIARIDSKGVDITNTLESLTEVVLPLSTGNRSYTILNRTRQNDFYLYYVNTGVTSDIPGADQDKIQEYIFTGSMSLDQISRTFGFPDGTLLNIPISSSVEDNLNFFNVEEGTYNIDTYPQKTISVNLSGTIRHTANILGVLGVGIYLVNPVDTSFDAMVGSYLLAEQNYNSIGTSSINLSTSINSSAITPGSYLTVIMRSTGGGAGTRAVKFESGAELKVGSAINATSSKELIVEPYLTQPFFNSDCDVMQGEVEGERPNPFLQDVDYSTDFDQPWNIGTYGKTSPVDINQALVAYCDWIGGTTPELNGKVAAHIKYIIDEEGNAISPNLSDTTVINVQHNFEENKEIDVSLIDPSAGAGMQVLNGIQKILKGGEIAFPSSSIIYFM